MPFKSSKQRKFLFLKKPEVAKKIAEDAKHETKESMIKEEAEKRAKKGK